MKDARQPLWKDWAARGVGLVCLVIGSGVLGCSTYTPSSSRVSAAQSPPASPRQHTMLENIPIPVGFRMVPERSVARESGRLRVAQCEFQGSTVPEHVAAFYQNYMPSAKFALKQRRLDNGEYKLRFESDSEECNIYVKPAKTSTVLVVDIGPLPRGRSERAAPPDGTPLRGTQ